MLPVLRLHLSLLLYLLFSQLSRLGSSVVGRLLAAWHEASRYQR